MRPTPENNICGCCSKEEHYNKKVSIQCGLCTLWFHAKCVNLTEVEMKFLTSSSTDGNNIHWFCNHCEVLTKPILKRLTTIEKSITTMESNLGRLNEKMESLENLNQRIENLEAKLSQSPSINPCQDKHSTHETDEVLARMKRVNNVIFFGILEKDPDDTNQQIEEIIKKLCPQTTTNKISRIGKNKNSDKPRPVIVELPTEKEKWLLIKKGNEKTNRESIVPPGVSIKPDLTKQQQLQEYKLRVELRSRRSSGETNLIIKKGKIVSKN